MSMELDDLFKEEGLDAAGVEDALAWARRRAAELVRDVDGDPELGPLLGGARVVGVTEGPRATASARPASPPGLEERPLFTDLRGLQAAFLAEADDEDADLPEVGAVLRAFQKGKGRGGSGPVRSASTTATKPRLSLDGDAGPAASFALDDLREEARSEAEREPVEAAPQSMIGVDERAAANHDDAPTSDTGATLDRADVASDDRADAELDADTTLPVAAAATEAAAEADASEPTTSDLPSDAAPEHGLPAPPEADLDPLAGIDFDDLPGVDEDDEEDDHTHVDLPAPGRVAAAADLEGRTTMIPTDGADMTLPSMQAPLAELGLGRSQQGGSLPSGELTERGLNPLIPPEQTGDVTVTAMAPNPLRGASADTSITDIPTSAKAEAAPADEPTAPEEPADEIELLDDEDLLLMEEEPEEEPEWKQALKSVEGKGGGEADGS